METEVKVVYEIWKAERELGYCKYNGDELAYKVGDVYDKEDCPELVESFDSKAEALEALKDYKCSVWKTRATLGELLNGREYYLQESEYDEDGEPLSGDVLVFAERDE